MARSTTVLEQVSLQMSQATSRVVRHRPASPTGRPILRLTTDVTGRFCPSVYGLI